VVVLHVCQEGLGGLDDIWVKQDLVDNRLDVGDGEKKLQVIDGEAVIRGCTARSLDADSLGNTDRLDFSFLVKLFHLLPCAWDVSFCHSRMMNEVQIDIFDTEFLERFLARLSSGLVLNARPFGGQPVFVSS
jgi:hypothetical protein